MDLCFRDRSASQLTFAVLRADCRCNEYLQVGYGYGYVGLMTIPEHNIPQSDKPQNRRRVCVCVCAGRNSYHFAAALDVLALEDTSRIGCGRRRIDCCYGSELRGARKVVFQSIRVADVFGSATKCLRCVCAVRCDQSICENSP